jgi:hypothetical protein
MAQHRKSPSFVENNRWENQVAVELGPTHVSTRNYSGHMYRCFILALNSQVQHHDLQRNRFSTEVQTHGYPLAKPKTDHASRLSSAT